GGPTSGAVTHKPYSPPMADYENDYDLEAYEWTSSIQVSGTDSLVLKVNGTEVVLNLSKDLVPPKSKGGDPECFNSLPLTAKVVATNEGPASVCVYISRCDAARHISVNAYQTSYCLVNDRYAGVCCPRNEIDK
ncbi:jg14896, partial [Pararge aegeria aegeria]